MDDRKQEGQKKHRPVMNAKGAGVEAQKNAVDGWAREGRGGQSDDHDRTRETAGGGGSRNP